MTPFFAALLLFAALAPAQVGPARIGNSGGDQTAAPRDCEGPVLRMSEVDVKPRIRSKPNPGYTEEARRKGVAGRVVLSVVLCKTGEVGDAEVVEGLPHGLSEEAIKAARRIRFEPARKDDERVSVRVRVLYHFNLY
ncbi:MAG TPA: energy transducer TonB [Pyrinomonadaceae bacterium]|jgi:protein TonB